MDARTPLNDFEKINARFDALARRIDELATPSGSAANQTVAQLSRLVNDIQQQLNDYIANGTYNKAQIDQKLADLAATKADLVHTHSASDIVSGGTTGAGFTVGGNLGVNGAATTTGDVTGARGIFPTGVRSTGARNNQLVTNYVVAYIDGAGNLGYAPSTKASKNDLGPYSVDMAKFLAINLREWSYKDDTEGRIGMGPFAEELDAAGLNEFVIYSDTGKIQGLRLESLVIGLWSAYVQSRTSTLARIGRQKYQTKTVTGMTALGLNSERTYDITWDEAFFDANYHVTADVTSSGLALSAVATVVPGSKTVTGCKITVRTIGLAIASGATLTAQGTHI